MGRSKMFQCTTERCCQKLQHILCDPMSTDVHENEELEDLFSFTTPTLEIETILERSTHDASSNKSNEKIDASSYCPDVDFDIALSSTSFSTLDNASNSWDSFNPFQHGPLVTSSHDSSTQSSSTWHIPESTQFDFQRCESFDEDTRELLEWLEKTDKPSQQYLDMVDLKEEGDLFQRLRNEVHQIFHHLKERRDEDRQRHGNSQTTIRHVENEESLQSDTAVSDITPIIQSCHENKSSLSEYEHRQETSADDQQNTIEFSSTVGSMDSSTSTDIRPLLPNPEGYSMYVPELKTIQPQDRPHLWTKALCSNKTMDDVRNSSLVDSFVHWHNHFDFQAFSEWCEISDDTLATALSPQGLSRSLSLSILQEATTLAKHIFPVSDSTLDIPMDNSCESQPGSSILTIDALCQNLGSLLVYYYQNENSNKKFISSSDSTGMDTWNPLLGPVTATLLSALIPLEIVSVMISTIGPVVMPLLSLTNEERKTAVKPLHKYLYQLVRYHSPVLALHLDQNIPNWFLPLESISKYKDALSESKDQDSTTLIARPRDPEYGGLIPITWFASLLAGECMENQPPKTLAIDILHQYWDFSLISQDASLKFFLAVALLDSNVNTLLTLKGPELVTEFIDIMTFQRTLLNRNDSIANWDDLVNPPSFLETLLSEAKVMKEMTPGSFLEVLGQAENDVVKQAILWRQKIMLEKEEKEESDRRIQSEMERLQKEEEAVNRSHLISFYEKHAPDKLSTVDNILQVYSGRVALLDQRLKKKYGVGFLPVSSSKTSASTAIKSLKQSIQQGLMVINERDSRKRNMPSTVLETSIERSSISYEIIFVPPCDVLTNIFESEVTSLNLSYPQSKPKCKYCIVDSRPEEVAVIQGRFHGSISLSPDMLGSSIRMKELHDSLLEKIRGDHHLCIMGGGISVLSKLYGHSTHVEDYLLGQDNDDCRTMACALYFINEGFPFVSIMDGGFAAAYAWLRRSSPQLESLVLSDIDRSLSLYVDLENNYQVLLTEAPSTSRSVQKIFDRSLAALTLGEQKIEASLSRFFTSRGDGGSKKE